MTIQTVGVLGCGLMGRGIAQICAQAGIRTYVLEAEQKFLDKGLGEVDKQLSKAVEKGKLTADAKDATMKNLVGTLKPEDLRDCDLVIEAIIENRDAKRAMYEKLDKIVKKEAIFATNTSSLTVTDLMTATSRVDRFIGLHFFNPVPVMKLVEVVKTITTSDATVEAAMGFAKQVGKSAVLAKDKTGFIVNRLLVPYIIDAIVALEQGFGSIRDIDEAMKLGCGYPMGPLTLLDYVGLDTTLYITEIMFDEFKEKRFAAPSLLKRMVMAGYMGRKSGKGFYDYSNPEAPTPNDYLVK